MFRVLFRVIKICIHIKQTLLLEVTFKKGNETIVSKDTHALIDGISNINTTTEFLITKDDPTFQLHINFTFKKVKRQAGFINLNLGDWNEGGSYQEIRKLQNAPGGKALIEFGFIFFDAGVSSLPKTLQSFEAFEKDMNEDYRAQISEQNLVLAQKLKELQSLKETLNDQKQIYNKMEEEISKTQTQFSNQASSKERRMDEVQSLLKSEEEKQAFLMELAQSSGSQDLLNYIRTMNQDGMDLEYGKSQSLTS